MTATTSQPQYKHKLHRRDVLGIAGAGTIALIAAPTRAYATVAEVQEKIDALSAGIPPREDSRLVINLPEIAENGGSVPLKVSVESPMSKTEFVEAVHIFAEENPFPQVSSYFFSPGNGKAAFSLRMRLAKSQNVIVVAKLNTGESWIGRKAVKVTIGGCGG